MNHGRVLPLTLSLQASAAKTCSSLTPAQRLQSAPLPQASPSSPFALLACSYLAAATALTGEAKRIENPRKSRNATLTEASAQILHQSD